MRLAVADHDKRSSPNVFDLNNPPRQSYMHQEFPTLVYDLDRDGKTVYRKVSDAEELADALDSGWAAEPKAPIGIELPPLDAASAAEVEAITKRVADARKKRAGRG